MPAKKTGKAEATETKARVLETKTKLTGRNTRVKGHLSATARRQQAKRDQKNA